MVPARRSSTRSIPWPNGPAPYNRRAENISMAHHLALEEQEQLDRLKHFWRAWGTPITSVLIVVAGAIAAWNGYQYWQNRQGAPAPAFGGGGGNGGGAGRRIVGCGGYGRAGGRPSTHGAGFWRSEGQIPGHGAGRAGGLGPCQGAAGCRQDRWRQAGAGVGGAAVGR